MSEGTQVVEQAYDAFRRGDIPGLLDLLDEGVEWASPKTIPHGGTFSGKAGVGQFFGGLGAAWSSLSLDIESVGEVADGSVVGIVRADGIRSGGKPGGYGAVHVFTVDNGKITRFREYVDLDGTLVEG